MKYAKLQPQMTGALVAGADGLIGSHLVEALGDGEETIGVFVRCSAFNARGRFGTVDNEMLTTVEIFSGHV